MGNSQLIEREGNGFLFSGGDPGAHADAARGCGRREPEPDSTGCDQSSRDDSRGNMTNELHRGGSAFRPGDEVMEIKNNYEKEVFNGDTV